MMMTGTADARRRVRNTSRPSMSGKPKSNSTRSQPLTRCRASAPRLLWMTEAPAWPRSSASADATPSSSSTSSTCMALMLGTRGRNRRSVDEFTSLWVKFAGLPLEIRTLRRFAHEHIDQQRDQSAARDVVEEPVFMADVLQPERDVFGGA